MLDIKPCATYHAVDAGRKMLPSADSRSLFKVYFVDIVGRPDPTRTEWARCGIRKADFLAGLARAPGVEGIGFVTAFPHITKVFRISPANENVIDVRGYGTRDLAPLDLARAGGYVEFACLAEAVIAADEFRFWAEAASVAEYRGRWSSWADGRIARNDKLRAYWPA